MGSVGKEVISLHGELRTNTQIKVSFEKTQKKVSFEKINTIKSEFQVIIIK